MSCGAATYVVAPRKEPFRQTRITAGIRALTVASRGVLLRAIFPRVASHDPGRMSARAMKQPRPRCSSRHQHAEQCRHHRIDIGDHRCARRAASRTDRTSTTLQAQSRRFRAPRSNLMRPATADSTETDRGRNQRNDAGYASACREPADWIEVLQVALDDQRPRGIQCRCQHAANAAQPCAPEMGPVPSSAATPIKPMARPAMRHTPSASRMPKKCCIDAMESSTMAIKIAVTEELIQRSPNEISENGIANSTRPKARSQPYV